MLKLQSSIAGALWTGALLVPATAQAQPEALYENGHADIAVSLAPGSDELRVEWRFDDALVNGEFRSGYWPIESTVAFSSATYQRPSSDSSGRFSFLGVAPGESTYYFPIDNTTAAAKKVPFLGWSNEVPSGILRSDTVEISLRSVQRAGGGQAEFSLWDIDVLSPRVYIASADGIDAQDKVSLIGHNHYFMNLSSSEEPAALIVSMQASARKLDGTQLRKNFDLQILNCTPGLNCPQDSGATPAPLMGGWLTSLLGVLMTVLALMQRSRHSLSRLMQTLGAKLSPPDGLSTICMALALASMMTACGSESGSDTAGGSGQGASATPTLTTGGENSSASTMTQGSSASGIPSGLEPGDPSGIPGTTTAPSTADSSTSESPTAGDSSTDSSSSDATGSSSFSSSVGSSVGSTAGTSSGSTSEEPEKKRKEYILGHGDIAVYYDEDNDKLRVAVDLDRATVDGTVVSQEYPVDELLIRSKARLTRPEEDPENLLAPLCVEKNESVAWFPASKSDCDKHSTPFLGWASRIRPRDLKDGFISIRVTGFRAPKAGGHVSMWTAQLPPGFMVSSCDGLDQKDELRMYSGHDHHHLGFAGAPGLWVVNYEASANLTNKPNTYKHSFSVHFWVE